MNTPICDALRALSRALDDAHVPVGWRPPTLTVDRRLFDRLCGEVQLTSRLPHIRAASVTVNWIEVKPRDF